MNQVAQLYGTEKEPNPQAGRVYDPNGISPCLDTCGGGNRMPKIIVPVLTPGREHKRQNGRRFKTNGEPSFTLTAQDQHGILFGYEYIETEDGIYEGLLWKDENGIFWIVRIRKLTPLECWRLQGFPDKYFYRAKYNTEISSLEVDDLHHRIMTKKEWKQYQRKTRRQYISDSQLYKQAGNSVTVPVIKAIGEKLK